MGTNYYHELPVNGARCETCGGALHCNRCDMPQLHIGKSSAGWTFSFQAHYDPPIRSYADWLAWLEGGGEIVDEYGETVTLDEFRKLVQAKSAMTHNHSREHPGDGNYLDGDGHSFSDREFS